MKNEPNGSWPEPDLFRSWGKLWQSREFACGTAGILLLRPAHLQVHDLQPPLRHTYDKIPHRQQLFFRSEHKT